MPRELKIHYATDIDRPPCCGSDGRRTANVVDVTCRACWFRILADVAPWARGFLDDLRGKARAGELDPILVPGPLTEPVNAKVKGLGNGFARAFSQQRGSEEAVREILSLDTPLYRPIEPVMGYSGPSAEPIWIKERKVANCPGDAGQIGHKAHGDFEPPV